MGVTAGGEVVAEIQRLQRDNMTEAVIFDAVASETTDACFDWMQEYLAQELVREGKHILSKRISCGYGDFSLEYQKAFYDLLGLKRFGITLTEAGMFKPEKTATAVTGIQ